MLACYFWQQSEVKGAKILIHFTRSLLLINDRIFTGFFELPGIGKLPVIQPNLPGITGKCKKTVFPKHKTGLQNFQSPLFWQFF